MKTGNEQQIQWNMDCRDMVRLYRYLSGQFNFLDKPMKKILYNLEKSLFNSITISRIQDMEEFVSGES